MRRRAFSLAELLVVMGVVAMLVALLLPTLRLVRDQAFQTKCLTQQRQIGAALLATESEFGFFPLWDDNGAPTRFTWIDVLVQLGHVPSAIGYCPADLRPDPLNEARAQAVEDDLVYPLDPRRRGVDYSFGIAVPLSAGGWAWQPTDPGPLASVTPRRFEEYDRYTARRILAGDGNWTALFNLSSDAVESKVWNDPTQFDNTVAWRHRLLSANFLFQDGHAAAARYRPEAETAIDTVSQFVWYPGEPIMLTPGDRYGDNYYPHQPPPNLFSTPPGDVYPAELLPRYYTSKRGWTAIDHK